MDLLSPANCLTFNIQRAARALSRRLDAALAPVGLSAQQFSVLAQLSARGVISTTSLAEAVGTERTTITRNLSVLRRRNLVESVVTDDARVNAVAVTKTGNKLVAEAMPLWTGAQERVVADIGQADAAHLLMLLRRL